MKLLIGGSPCTRWSTVQLGDAFQVRETDWKLLEALEVTQSA